MRRFYVCAAGVSTQEFAGRYIPFPGRTALTNLRRRRALPVVDNRNSAKVEVDESTGAAGVRAPRRLTLGWLERGQPGNLGSDSLMGLCSARCPGVLWLNQGRCRGIKPSKELVMISMIWILKGDDLSVLLHPVRRFGSREPEG